MYVIYKDRAVIPENNDAAPSSLLRFVSEAVETKASQKASKGIINVLKFSFLQAGNVASC